MLRKFDRFARKDCFVGKTREEFEQWRSKMRTLLKDLLGFEKMETCPLSPVLEETVILPGGVRREHVRIQVAVSYTHLKSCVFKLISGAVWWAAWARATASVEERESESGVCSWSTIWSSSSTSGEGMA